MKKLLLVILALMLSAGLWAQEKITLTAEDFMVTPPENLVYDKTTKEAKVEISEEYIMPESSNMTIYYNNDKKVKPIDPGTYQVYIDIEETDTYAAVTGITSDAWKFDIIDPEGAIQAIKDKKKEAVQAINNEAGYFETVPIVQEVVEGAQVNFEEITITATNTIKEATDQSTITTTKDNAISKIDEIVASAKTNIQTAIAKFKESVKNEIDNAATATKSEIDAFPVSKKVKDDAKSEIDNAVAVAEETIDNANSKEQIDNAKKNALSKFSIQVAEVKAYYDQLQDDKVAAIQKIEEVAADAEAAIDEAAGKYASLQAIWEIISSKKEEIASRKGEASHFIGVATDMEDISQQKEEAIQHIENIKSSAEEKIQTAIQEFIALQEDAINEVEQVAATAKEEINGLGVDEDTKKEGKAQIDNIANTAKATINEATETDMINEAKTQAISKIYDVVQNLKEMWSLTVSELGWTSLYYDKDLKIPNGVKVYYASGQSGDVVYLLEIKDNIPANTAVIVKAEPGTYRSTFAEKDVAPLADGANLFKGLLTDSLCSKVSSDEGGKTIYVLAGKDADGVLLFQPFNMTLNLKANKAYLPIDNGGTPSQSIKFRIADEEDVTDINSFRGTNADGKAVNLLGVPVSDSYKGIVLKGGKKILR